MKIPRQTPSARRCGVLVGALLALFLLPAPATAAEGGAITAAAPFTLDAAGEEASPLSLTAFETTMSCASSAYAGEAVGGGTIESGAQEATASPAYEECATSEVLPTTFTANGCDYVLALGEEEAEDEYALSTEISCPAESYIVIDIYLSAEAHKNDGGHEILPIDGHRFSPLADTKPPQWRPSDLPTEN